MALSVALSSESVVSRVRQNAFPAGLAAACLLFAGFFWLAGGAIGTPLFLKAYTLCVYTLRIGGVALAVTAVLCLSGRPFALLTDSIVSIAIGLGLLAAALLMVIAGAIGLDQFLYLLFGGIFVSAGFRSGREYFTLVRSSPAAQGVARRLDFDSTEYDAPAATALPERTLSERLSQERSASVDAATAVGAAEDAPPRHTQSAVPMSRQPSGPSDVEPPEGFLAAFAKKGPPRRE